MKEVFIKTLSMGIVLCILTACTGRPSPSTYSNSSATSSDSNVEADNKNTEPTATGFKNLTRPYYSVLGCGGESGYYETRARDDGSANVTYIDYVNQNCINNGNSLPIIDAILVCIANFNRYIIISVKKFDITKNASRANRMREVF